MASKKNNKKVLPVAVILIALITIINVVNMHNNHSEDDVKTVTDTNADGVVVHYLDVGQGDSEFIELPDGMCMLIDAGTYEYGDDIVSSVESYGYSKIDYVVATHPHADHIGGMKYVIDNLDIGEIYMPRVTTDTKTYEKLLESISDKGLKINTARSGKTILSTSSVSIELLAPVSDSYKELNNYSAVVKLTYGQNKFLFMGDAEKLVEDEMLQNGVGTLDCDVLKVGHHGSSYSSSMNFLKAVSPEYAVISCGIGNSYGHPHKESLERLAQMNSQVYRTDQLGEITISCDGNNNFKVVADTKK